MSYYDEDYYEPDEEETEEYEAMNGTEVKNNENEVEIRFDTNAFVAGVVRRVKDELFADLLRSLKNEYMEELKKKIESNVNDIVREIIDEYMNNEKITVGNGWDRDPETYTLKQYAKKCIKESIEKGTFTIKDKNAYSGQRSVSFTDYIKSNLKIEEEVKLYLDREIGKVRDEINKNVKQAFDESTRAMLSQTVLNILMTNDTYKKIEGNIASIANANN